MIAQMNIFNARSLWMAILVLCLIYGDINALSQTTNVTRSITISPVSAAQTNFYPNITNVNCIVVTTGNLDNLPAKWITDPKQIQEILTFVNRQHAGWHQPMLSDTPTGPVVLRFFDGNSCKAFLGIGDNFFSVGQNVFGDAWCKDATEKQKKEIFSILGPTKEL